MTSPAVTDPAPTPIPTPAAQGVRHGETMLGLLRIGAALLFMQHGAQKLLGAFGGMGGSGQSADLVSQMGLAGVIELGGGLLLALGLLTRPVAIVLALQMVAAYLIAHLPRGMVPIENGGELALLYLLVFLAIAVLGPGRFALDRRAPRLHR